MTESERSTLVKGLTATQQRHATMLLFREAMDQGDNLYFSEIFQAYWQYGSYSALKDWVKDWIQNTDRTAQTAQKASLHAIALMQSSTHGSIPWNIGMCGLVVIMLATDAASAAWGLDMLLYSTYQHRTVEQVNAIIAPVLGAQS